MKNPWEKIQQPIKDVSALRIDPNHPLDFYWAIDHIGRYLFIYQFPYNSDLVIKDLPDFEGIEIVSMSTNTNDTRLVLLLKEKSNWELFFALCNDLISSTSKSNSSAIALNTIFHRLRRWSELLKKKRLDVMSEEKIKGLIGELLFIQKHLIPLFGPNNSIKFWLGPDGAPQDFNINDCAIEVKCQIGGTYPNIKISSAEQLYSQLSKLYLYVITLGKSTSTTVGVVNLPMLISEITILLECDSENINLFRDKLMDVGYFFSEKYMDYNYILSAEHVYDVCDEFPKICPCDLKLGIMKVTYSISLLECAPYELDISNWDLRND